jgi:heme oxygenase
MTTTDTVDAIRFSEQIRDATRQEHEAAEREPFVGDLMAGTLPLDAYVDLVAQLWFVYDALEHAGDVVRADPVAGRFVVDELRRVPALSVDLEHLLGPAWRAEITPLPATAAYRDRIEEVGRTWPAGFVAHHYTRYLGDLSGGRILGRAIRDTYGFGDGPGASFTAFPEIPQPNRFKVDYRTSLDAVPWSGDEREAVVDEARAAFRHNQAVFAGLQAGREG